MNKFKNITIIVLFAIIGILLLLKQCDSKPKDITYIKGKDIISYDTIEKPYKVVKLVEKYYPQPIRFDTIEKTKIDTNLCKVQRTYQDSIEDSSIVIYRTIKTTGTLDYIKTDYRLKYEIVKNINRIDTLIKSPKLELIGLGGIGGNKSQFNAAIGLGIKYKKAYYGYEYDFINKTHNAKIGFSIFKSRK